MRSLDKSGSAGVSGGRCQTTVPGLRWGLENRCSGQYPRSHARSYAIGTVCYHPNVKPFWILVMRLRFGWFLAGFEGLAVCRSSETAARVTAINSDESNAVVRNPISGNTARTGRATRLGLLLPSPLPPSVAAHALEGGGFHQLAGSCNNPIQRTGRTREWSGLRSSLARRFANA